MRILVLIAGGIVVVVLLAIVVSVAWGLALWVDEEE